MNAWTPAPWKIDTDTQGYVVIVAGNRTVCLVGPEEDPTSETDAQALVLLPEMAEVLRQCVKMLDDCCQYALDLGPINREKLEKARALLAKLEGGEK